MIPLGTSFQINVELVKYETDLDGIKKYLNLQNLKNTKIIR